jgi:hypothetical protein
VRTAVASQDPDSWFQERKTVKLIRSIVGAVTGKNAEEKPWEFAPLQAEKPVTLDERRGAEQAKQIKLGYSVEIINKGEGVRYTEGLRVVEVKIGWEGGAGWCSTRCHVGSSRKRASSQRPSSSGY